MPLREPGEARVYLDESLRRFDTVYPAAGTAASAVEMSIASLESLSGAITWVDVTTGWREEAPAEA